MSTVPRQASAVKAAGHESAPTESIPDPSILGPETISACSPEVKNARTILRLVTGEDVPDAELAVLQAAPIDWLGLASQLKRGKRNRQGIVDRWIRNLTRPDVRDTITHALEVARHSPPEEPEQEAPAFSLDLISTEDFFGQTFNLDFLVKGLIVRGENCVFGGPQKSLKTSLLIDLAISVASGTPFLGRFAVPQPSKVALISGESGKAVIQANAKQACIERELPYHLAADVHWGFVIPRLSDSEHLVVLRKTIEDLGIKLILLDPLYLMLLSGSAGIDPKDMFQMGPLLADVSATCIEAGATPVLCHHFVKKREDPYGPPDISELAYAGIGQFMRQWMLTARRERFDAESGIHALHFHYGGSAGHSGELHLDIETGRLDDELRGRRWVVNVLNPSESRQAKQEEQVSDRVRNSSRRSDAKEAVQQAQEETLMARFLDLLLEQPGRQATMKTMRNATGWRKEKVDRITWLLERRSSILPTQVPTPMPSGRIEHYPGFRINDDQRS